MLGDVLSYLKSGDALLFVGILVPILLFAWTISTVMALHKRDVYFWGLGSTWSSIIACPAAVIIMSLSTLSRLDNPNAPVYQAPILAGVKPARP